MRTVLFFGIYWLANIALLASENPQTRGFEPDFNSRQYVMLKQYNDDQLLWIEDNHYNLAALTFSSLLTDIGFIAEIEKINHNGSNAVQLDQILTAKLFEIANLFNGYQFKPKEKPAEEIIIAVKNNRLVNYVDRLLPQFDEVILLRQAIRSYKTLSLRPWPAISSSFTPRLGQGHQQIKMLRIKLAALGDLNNNQLNKNRQHIFEPEVILALKKFQRRHGLKQTGTLDHRTRAALAVSPRQRVATLQKNLWRWLSLPSEPPDDYVLINIPSYRLFWIENKREKLSMKVIVGNKNNPTPIMVTYINRITVNPDWTPTKNIVKNELLPQNSQQPGILKQQNFKLAKGPWHQRQFVELDKQTANISQALKTYDLVQMPGKSNALGKYRFNIKNNHSVYLHDTPSKYLFSKNQRALSHGCVRLQFSSQLAQQFLIFESKSKQERAKHAALTQSTTHIRMSATVPVYITYQTAWVNNQGQVHWRDDIYQLDHSLHQASSMAKNKVAL